MKQAFLILSILVALSASFLIIPEQASAEIVTCDGVVNECKACDFIQLGNNLLRWFIGVMASVIALVFAWGGMKMVMAGGDTSALWDAKEMMTNSIIGFIILLSAWLIIDTVIKLVVSPSSGLGMWHTIECVGGPVGTTGTLSPTGTVAPVTSGPHLSHEDAAKRLKDAGIGVVSTGNCSDRTNKSCTSLASIEEQTINTVTDIAKKCNGCNLQVSAGTETGHSNRCHVDGTCVDLQCSNGCTAAQRAQIFSAAEASNARPVFETLSCATRDAARAQGIPAYCKSDPKYEHITGDHFSIYRK